MHGSIMSGFHAQITPEWLWYSVMSERKPTSGTRHGNGKGHGGPAKGFVKNERETLATKPFAPGQSGNPTGMPGYRAMEKAARMDAMKEMLWDRAFDKTEKTVDRINAANSFMNREEGLPIARQINTDDANAWFIHGAPESRTVEEWTSTHALGTVTPAGSAD